MDNYFTNIPLHTLYHRTLHIGACGTLQMNYIPANLRQEFSDNARVPWNDLTTYRTNGPHIKLYRWSDNNIVKMLSSIHSEDWISAERRKPRTTSTRGTFIRQAFEAAAGATRERTRFLIPDTIEDYNQHMGGVDIADQLRSYYKTQRMERRNWLPLFYWLLDIPIVNSYLLYHVVTNDTESYTCTFKLPPTSQQLASVDF